MKLKAYISAMTLTAVTLVGCSEQESPNAAITLEASALNKGTNQQGSEIEIEGVIEAVMEWEGINEEGALDMNYKVFLFEGGISYYLRFETSILTVAGMERKNIKNGLQIPSPASVGPVVIHNGERYLVKGRVYTALPKGEPLPSPNLSEEELKTRMTNKLHSDPSLLDAESKDLLFLVTEQERLIRMASRFPDSYKGNPIKLLRVTHFELTPAASTRGKKSYSPEATVQLKTILESPSSENIKEIQHLITAGADVNAQAGDGLTPILAASYFGNTEAVNLLINEKADLNHARIDGVNSLYMAVQNEHEEIVKQLIEAGASVNDTTDSGQTSLLIAAGQGSESVVKLLIDAKADVNIAENSDGITPLHIASLRGHTNIAKLLIDAKANVDAIDELRQTPLWISAKSGHIEIVKLLIDSGANINYVCSFGFTRTTPLDEALVAGHTEIARILREAGAKE